MLLHNLIAIGLAATATAQIPGLPIPGVPGASGVPSVPEVPGIPGAPGVPGIDKLTPEKLIENIKNITQQSEALQKPVNDISSGNLNGSLPFIGDSPLAKVFTGFTDIVSLATSTVSGAKNLDKVPAGPVADAVFEGFRQFVKVHQELLNLLIGKSGVITAVPLIGQPIAALLRQVENVVDQITNTLINLAESRAKDIEEQAKLLTGTLQEAISKFGGPVRRSQKAQKFPRRWIFNFLQNNGTNLTVAAATAAGTGSPSVVLPTASA